MEQPLIPQFLKIREALREQIREGLMVPGSKLPAERKLADAFDTTRITLREALVLLEAEGQIYREERRGWFVAPERLNYDPGVRSDFHRMVDEQQRCPETRWLNSSTIAANPALCRQMELTPLDPLYRIDRVRLIDDRPVLYVEHYLKPEIFPGILEHDLNGSLTRIYESEYGIQIGRVRFEIYPTALVGIAAEQLNVAQGSQGLQIIRVNYDQNNRLIDCDFEFWRHDAIRVRVDTQQID